MQTEVKLVCFDLGGVLVRIADGWEDICARVGVQAPPSCDTDEILGVEGAAAELDCGRLRPSDFIAMLVRSLPGLTAEQGVAMFDAWLIDTYDGAFALLDALKDQGTMTACLSNTNSRHWDRMMKDSRLNVLDRLTHLFASHEVGYRKPQPEVYVHVEERLSLAPRQILFFDDVDENVVGARARGWSAELIDRMHPTAPQLWNLLRRHGVIEG